MNPKDVVEANITKRLLEIIIWRTWQNMCVLLLSSLRSYCCPHWLGGRGRNRQKLFKIFSTFFLYLQLLLDIFIARTNLGLSQIKPVLI